MGLLKSIFAAYVFLSIFFPEQGFCQELFDSREYSFLTENSWSGKNQYTGEEFIVEFMEFKRKPESTLYKARRERNNIYLLEIFNNREYFPDIDGDPGSYIMKLNSEIYQVEDMIELDDGNIVNAPVTLYRQINLGLKASSDMLEGDWAFKSSPDDIHEYRKVIGEYQFLVYIPDYDWYSKYAEDGWHYLRFTGSNEFETDDSFYDARFRLTVKSEKELILRPLFLKHDNTDGAVILKAVEKK